MFETGYYSNIDFSVPQNRLTDRVDSFLWFDAQAKFDSLGAETKPWVWFFFLGVSRVSLGSFVLCLANCCIAVCRAGFIHRNSEVDPARGDNRTPVEVRVRGGAQRDSFRSVSQLPQCLNCQLLWEKWLLRSFQSQFIAYSPTDQDGHDSVSSTVELRWLLSCLLGNAKVMSHWRG